MAAVRASHTWALYATMLTKMRALCRELRQTVAPLRIEPAVVGLGAYPEANWTSTIVESRSLLRNFVGDPSQIDAVVTYTVRVVYFRGRLILRRSTGTGYSEAENQPFFWDIFMRKLPDL